LHDRLEVGASSAKIRLAIRLDEHRRPAALVHPRGDDTFSGRAARLVGGGGSLLAEDLLGLSQIAVGLRKRALARHHAHSGLVPKLLHQARRDLHHVSPTPLLPKSPGTADDRTEALAVVRANVSRPSARPRPPPRPSRRRRARRLPELFREHRLSGHATSTVRDAPRGPARARRCSASLPLSSRTRPHG